MTIMHIQIPDDLKEAFEKAFPAETLEQAVERLLRAEIERGQATAKGGQSLLERARRLREKSPPTSNEEIRALRHEGRP